MNLADLHHLQSHRVQQLVEQYIDSDPIRVALQTRDRVLSDQVKYLARAKTKLPLWYSARCVIDSRLFEQCSSQVTADAKFEGFVGDRAIDLTCGLGVDSFALSSRFSSVVSVEVDEVKAEVARYNFSLLNTDNVGVVSASAEEFCQNAVDRGIRADLIFVDPSRVDPDGKKVYSLDQSSPNVLKIMPLMRKISNRIIIKLSPLFDVDECFRLFDCVKMVDVVSVNGECKEVNVVIDTSHKASERIVNHTVIRPNKVRRHPISTANLSDKRASTTTPKHYLCEADVAFYKSRCVEKYVAQSFEDVEFTFDNYIFTSHRLTDFAGTIYSIEDIIPYNSRKIRKLLESRTITAATIHLRDFPVSQQELYKILKIKEGSSIHLFFTKTNGEPTCYIVNPLNNR